MSGFIMRAACRGRRPGQFSGFAGRERPALLGRLLQDRNVARFIVAPHGYGKTSLALEYAETMFSWAHTFWVNAQSPCFIRDLDNDDFADELLVVDPAIKLAVFDDVPVLNSNRAEALSTTIDKLLAAHCEVLVTSCPANDSMALHQRDRVLLGAHDMLLDDGELDALRTPAERGRTPSAQLSSIHRIAALAWSSRQDGTALPDAHAQFAHKTLEEDLPSDYLLAMASAMALQKGTRAQLQAFVSLNEGELAELVQNYPHISFDDSYEQFEFPFIEVEDLSAALKKNLPRIARFSAFDSGDDLVRAWADLLVSAGQPERACDLMRAVYPRQKCPDWLMENAYELMRQYCFFPVLRLVVLNARPKGARKRQLHALETVCRRMLGDTEGAKRRAKLCAFDDTASWGVRIIGLVALAESGEETIMGQVVDALEAIVQESADEAAHFAAGAFRTEQGAYASPVPGALRWPLLAEAQCASLKGIQALACWWLQHADQHIGADTLCVVASWLFNLAGSSQNSEPPETTLALRSCERFVRELLLESPQPTLDFFTASAALAMEEAHGRGMRYDAGPLEAASLIKLRNYEMDLMAQRRRFEEERRYAQRVRENWANAHPDALLVRDPVFRDLHQARNTPILTLKLFGCFDASIGGEPIDKAKFSRKNTRSLLVVLAVNGGREVSRDVIVNSMWPGGNPESGKKNLYAVWSNLRDALSLPDGTCPYLLRHQFGCSLDPHYVHSDVERLEEICRELLFSVPSVEQWSLLFSEIDRDFSHELMPSETRNPVISQARLDYRNRLVDALTGATVSLVDAGTPQWGIWFSRMALKHDDTREDAYIALMRAQIACNQRTAAMMTFLKLRQVLSERLGIDPSQEAQELYRSLLDSN